MPDEVRSWAVVLAAGEGSRLRRVSVDAAGLPVPKQYWAPRGGRSLLARTLDRARAVVPERQVITIVAADHRPFWQREFGHAPPASLVVQPQNRGTAAGVLLPLLSILERDPQARVVVFPSDHHARDEAVLQAAICRAVAELEQSCRQSVVLLGITAESPEPDYGWIVPQPGTGDCRRVGDFVEKPNRAIAERLQRNGGLWNSFLFAARGRLLLELFARRCPDLVEALGEAFALPAAARQAGLERVYAELPRSDFCRDVLQGAEENLRVLIVPPCGWTDLGTPERAAACLGVAPVASPIPLAPMAPRRINAGSAAGSANGSAAGTPAGAAAGGHAAPSIGGTNGRLTPIPEPARVVVRDRRSRDPVPRRPS